MYNKHIFFKKLRTGLQSATQLINPRALSKFSVRYSVYCNLNRSIDIHRIAFITGGNYSYNPFTAYWQLPDGSRQALYSVQLCWRCTKGPAIDLVIAGEKLNSSQKPHQSSGIVIDCRVRKNLGYHKWEQGETVLLILMFQSSYWRFRSILHMLPWYGAPVASSTAATYIELSSG